jgi:hypothetical protein
MTSTLKITVLHNVAADEHGRSWGFFGYVPGHPLVPVVQYEEAGSAIRLPQACEAAFERFNVGTDEIATDYRERRNRSLSVGDVLAIQVPTGTTVWYTCQSVGWVSITAPRWLVFASKNGTTALNSREMSPLALAEHPLGADS